MRLDPPNLNTREILRFRRKAHQSALQEEMERLTSAAAKMGVKRIILFGSLVHEKGGITSDLDILMVWETPLNFLERTAEMYRRLRPQVPTDILIYTPAEVELMAFNPMVKRALEEGRVLYDA